MPVLSESCSSGILSDGWRDRARGSLDPRMQTSSIFVTGKLHGFRGFQQECDFRVDGVAGYLSLFGMLQ